MSIDDKTGNDGMGGFRGFMQNHPTLQKRAMTKDFSWDSSAEKYVELFARAIELHK